MQSVHTPDVRPKENNDFVRLSTRKIPQNLPIPRSSIHVCTRTPGTKKWIRIYLCACRRKRKKRDTIRVGAVSFEGSAGSWPSTKSSLDIIEESRARARGLLSPRHCDRRAHNAEDEIRGKGIMRWVRGARVRARSARGPLCLTSCRPLAVTVDKGEVACSIYLLCWAFILIANVSLFTLALCTSYRSFCPVWHRCRGI